MLHGCHSLCFNDSLERDIVSHVLLFVRLIVVFSSQMDVKVHATQGLYNVLVQLANDALMLKHNQSILKKGGLKTFHASLFLVVD
jgi:hypothetical protein